MKVVVKEDKYVTITIRVPEIVMDSLDASAKECEVSRQTMIQETLRAAIRSRDLVVEIKRSVSKRTKG